MIVNRSSTISDWDKTELRDPIPFFGIGLDRVVLLKKSPALWVSAIPHRIRVISSRNRQQAWE
jgi:hypothetical protein